MNRVPMHFNLQAKMNGMYGSGAMPLYGGNYNNSGKKKFLNDYFQSFLL